MMPPDIAEPTHCRAVVAHAVQEFSRIDLLVNTVAFQMTHESLAETHCPVRT